MPGDNGMVSVSNQHRVSIPDRQSHVSFAVGGVKPMVGVGTWMRFITIAWLIQVPTPTVGGVKPMVGVGTWMSHAIVINLIEIHFVRGIVNVVLMRRIA